MKAKLLLFAVFCGLTVTAFAQDGKEGSDEILRKSNLANGSFPRPWTAFPTISAANNNRPDKSSPAASTGYYIVDSDDDAGDYWRPNLDKAYTNLETDLQKPPSALNGVESFQVRVKHAPRNYLQMASRGSLTKMHYLTQRIMLLQVRLR
jgi:hypothetical protein